MGINLQALIDEVLGMVGKDQELRKKKLSEESSQSWDDTPAGQNYWKDIRGRNTLLETGAQNNRAQMDIARENNTGQMARQKLMEDTKLAENERAYNIDLYKTRIGENIGRFDSQTKRMQVGDVQKGVLGDQLKAATAVMGDLSSTDEDRKLARNFIFSSFKQPGQEPSQKNAVQPPDGILSDKKSAGTSTTPSGAASMEFASDEILRKRKIVDRNKKVEEDMFGKPRKNSIWSGQSAY